ITVLTDLQGPQNRLVDMATTDHGETRGGTEGGSAGQDGDGVFTCVDDVRVKLIVVRCRAHLHDSVFTLEGDPGSSGDEIRDPGGKTDAEVDVFTVVKLLRGTHRHLVSVPPHLVMRMCGLHDLLPGCRWQGAERLETALLRGQGQDPVHVDSRQVDLIVFE